MAERTTCTQHAVEVLTPKPRLARTSLDGLGLREKTTFLVGWKAAFSAVILKKSVQWTET
ncbi:hypothetical protein HDV57DRAFT_495273 [Trichoderma longibrachiatum]